MGKQNQYLFLFFVQSNYQTMPCHALAVSNTTTAKQANNTIMIMMYLLIGFGLFSLREVL